MSQQRFIRILSLMLFTVLLSAILVLGSRNGAALAAPPSQNPGVLFDLGGVTQNWDKTLPANDPGGACPSNSSRFTCVMGGAAVRDNETGLVWEQSPQTRADTWNEDESSFLGAGGVCINKTVGGRKGWRLPSIPELVSLVDPNAASAPFLPAGHPFSNVQLAIGQVAIGYWSASTVAFNPSNAWNVHFSSGLVLTLNKSNADFVWCVRGPMQESVY